MYLKGNFNRVYFADFLGSNYNPMSLVFLCAEITKDDLARTAQDDDYQVIDIDVLTYYNPKQNKWVKIGTINNQKEVTQ